MKHDARIQLWTTWCDYYATGEGRTLMALTGPAEDEASAKRQFAARFGEFAARGATSKPGLVNNDVTQFLWSPKMLTFIEQSPALGGLSADARLHFNFA